MTFADSVYVTQILTHTKSVFDETTDTLCYSDKRKIKKSIYQSINCNC